MSHLHVANPHELPGLYRVCLQTGDSGRDATHLYRDPDLLGHVYVGPYVVGQPELAFALTDAEGVCGYVLGAEDTRAFEAWQEAHWWPALREQYPLTGGDSLDDLLIHEIHRPSRRPDAVVTAYPAHLHIDLVERVRGQGMGRVMVERLLTALRDRGSTGVHLDVAIDNENAIGFYGHLGFVELESTPDALFMGLRLEKGRSPR